MTSGTGFGNGWMRGHEQRRDFSLMWRIIWTIQLNSNGPPQIPFNYPACSDSVSELRDYHQVLCCLMTGCPNAVKKTGWSQMVNHI